MKILYLPNEYSQQRQRQKKTWVYPVLMSMEAEYYRQQGHSVCWDAFSCVTDKVIREPEGIPFLKLPAPDRVFTNAFDKKYQKYGNYKYHPATHMQVADGCWWGKCSFCVEIQPIQLTRRPTTFLSNYGFTQGEIGTAIHKIYEVRPLDDVMKEIDECHRLGFKEIFDDSGTFPDGKWLEEFCLKMECKNYKIVLGCNMRINGKCDFKLMKKAGFRMVLFGIESANKSTLDRLQKGINANEIIPTIKRAADAGLDPHVAVMFGFPWETEEEELRTLELVHYLLKKGYAKTAQASLYDVKGVSAIDRGNVKKIYNAAYNLEFWYNKLINIKSIDDCRYLLKQIKAGLRRQ